MNHEPISGARASTRRLYVDWLRGFAVLLMVMWHSIDAWHEPTNRGTGAFLSVTFLAGWAAPMFLFLAGLSMALAGSSRVRAGASRSLVARSLARRGWMVFLLAHLFRLQSFLLNPYASWNGILKPDILNVLGLGLVAAAHLWSRAISPREKLIWLLGPAVFVALVLTPWAPTWWWPTLLYSRFEAYIRPVGTQGQFSLFPAVAFLFAGAFVGSVLAERVTREGESSFHRFALAVGTALVGFGIAIDATPGLASVAWVQPAAVVTWRTGAIVVLLSTSWWWLSRRAQPSRWHPLVVFGQTSLFVYWVHVELAYGTFTYMLRKSLTLPSALAACALFLSMLYVAAAWWLRRPAGPLVPPHMVATRRFTSSASVEP